MELWKLIPSTKGKYSASSIGRIKNNSTGHILHPFNITHGYLGCMIGDKQRIVHRLVAEAFLENFNDLPEVNHKNFIKSDNRIENIEMMTRKKNMEHARGRPPISTCSICGYKRLNKGKSNCPKRHPSRTLKRQCVLCGYSWNQDPRFKPSKQCKGCGSSLWSGRKSICKQPYLMWHSK